MITPAPQNTFPGLLSPTTFLWEKARRLFICDLRRCLPFPMFKPWVLDTAEWFLYECLTPVPNLSYSLRIRPAFLMMELFPLCIIDLASFIQQIFVENLSCSELAACQLLMLKNLVISALFFLSWKPVPDSFVLSAYLVKEYKISRSSWVFIWRTYF